MSSLDKNTWNNQFRTTVADVPDAVSLKYTATANQYTLTINLYENDEFKIVQVAKDWDFKILGTTLDANRGDTNIVAYGTAGDENFKVNTSGNYTFTFTVDGENKATAYVRNNGGPIQSLTLEDTAITKAVGEEHQITAIVAPTDAQEKDNISYASSDMAVAEVSSTGKVTAKAVGTATITVTCGNKTATCAVTVLAATVPATSVTLNVTEKTIHANDEFTLIPTVSPSNTTDNVNWSATDGTGKVSVDQTGKIKGLLPGNATVTVKYNNNVTATCAVTVEKTLYLVGGESKNPAVSWTAHDKYNQINEKILFTKGTDGKYSLDIDLTEGSCFGILTLGAENHPSAGNKYYGQIGKDSLATREGNVNKTDEVGNINGDIKILKYGRYKITVDTQNKVSIVRTGDAVDKINPVVSVTLPISTKSLVWDVEGQKTYQITPTINPDDADEKNNITYSSSDTDVAEVNGTGLVTAKKSGTAIITVRCGDTTTGKTATLTIKSRANNEKVNVSSVALNKTTLTLHAGEDETLTATVLPADTTEGTVTWSAKDKDAETTTFVTVDQTGKVTAVKPGTAVITATADGKTATCEVTVTTDYYLIGVPNDWIVLTKYADAAVKFTQVGETTVYQATNVTLFKNQEFKVAIVGNNWLGSCGATDGSLDFTTATEQEINAVINNGSNNPGDLKVNKDGTYTITLTVATTTKIKVERTGDATDGRKIYIKGDLLDQAGWKHNFGNQYKFAYDATTKKYTFTLTIDNDDINKEFGFEAYGQYTNKEDGTWIGKGALGTTTGNKNADFGTHASNFKTPATAGTYSIVITVEDDGSFKVNFFAVAPTTDETE